MYSEDQFVLNCFACKNVGCNWTLYQTKGQTIETSTMPWYMEYGTNLEGIVACKEI